MELNLNTVPESPTNRALLPPGCQVTSYAVSNRPHSCGQSTITLFSNRRRRRVWMMRAAPRLPVRKVRSTLPRTQAWMVVAARRTSERAHSVHVTRVWGASWLFRLSHYTAYTVRHRAGEPSREVWRRGLARAVGRHRRGRGRFTPRPRSWGRGRSGCGPPPRCGTRPPTARPWTG